MELCVSDSSRIPAVEDLDVRHDGTRAAHDGVYAIALGQG